MPKVSIILPIYNVEQYLDEALTSVCRQTLRDIEIICVNDGSKDSSPDIIKKYAAKDERIVVLDGPNGGYGKAMNRGIDAATGEYIGILEPDDYLPLDMMEDLYSIAKKNDLDIVKADFYRFGTNSNGDVNMSYNHLDRSGERYGELIDPSHDPSVVKFIMNTWSGIYRRAFLEEFHIRHNETPGASFQDNGFFFKTAIHAKRMMIVNHPYYRNRRDNPNSSVKSKEKVYCINVEYDYIREFLMEDKEVWERYKAMYSWKKFNNYLFTVQRISEEYKLPYIERMSAEFRRGLEQQEYSMDVFTELEQKKLKLILKSPQKYYEEYVLPTLKKEGSEKKKSSRSSAAERELEMIRNSTTYKVGKAIMFVPCALKRAVTGK